jgi:hypothetical protein
MSPENEMTPKQEMRYADELASRLPKDLTTEEEILEAGFKLAEKDIGRRSAIYYFQYDEDFASDFVSAYKEATPLGALSGQKYESLGQAFMKKHLAQEGVVDTIKKGIKSVKRGMAGWDKEAEGPGGEKPADPKDIVKRNKGYDDETVQRLAKTSNFGLPFGKDAKAGDKTPRGLQRKVLDREIAKRGLTKESVIQEAAIPFKKGEQVIIIKKGVLGKITEVDKAWEYLVINTVDGKRAKVDFSQLSQIKKYKGPSLTAAQAQEIAELIKNGQSPEEVSKIMNVPASAIECFEAKEEAEKAVDNSKYPKRSEEDKWHANRLARSMEQAKKDVEARNAADFNKRMASLKKNGGKQYPEVDEAKDDSYYTTSSSKAAELMKERFGPTTRSTDKDGRWIFKDKDGVQVALSDIDGEGDRTWNIFKSKALKEWGLTYGNGDWKDKIDPEELEKELITYLKKKGGKMWFKSDAYSYLMDASKPTTLVATDGSVIKVKKLIDVEKYVNKYDFADWAESFPEDWDDFFRPVKKGASNDQADHEAKTRMGEAYSAQSSGDIDAMNNQSRGLVAKHLAAKKRAQDEACPSCNGKGKAEGKKCSYCSGTGVDPEIADFTPKSKVKESLIRDMMKMIPRGILGEASVRKTDAELAKEKGQCESCYGSGLLRGNQKCPACNGTGKPTKGSQQWGQKSTTAPIKEAAAPKFQGADVSHEPDGVMVLVFGPGDAGESGDYYGINVVFGKPGTKPKLVTDDKWADKEAKQFKTEIIAAAEKRLGKEEKEHLASL